MSVAVEEGARRTMSATGEAASPANQHFAANLRYLCEQHGSISTTCRKIRINRQQFNKYLSGTHRPSPQNIRLIANHFGVSPALLYSDSEEFRALVEGNYFYAMESLRHSPRFATFLEMT